MVNKKISELDPAATITGTEVIPLLQAGTTKAATVSQLLALVVASAPGNLDTFFEVATQMGLDEATIATLQTLVAGKANTRTELYCDFSQYANGTPTKATTGQPLGIWDNGLNTSGYTINNGYLAHGTPTAANAASYLETQLGGTVKRLGARALFSTVTTGAKIALVNWQTSLTAAKNANSSNPIPYGSPHFTADLYGFSLTVWQSTANGPTLYAETSTTAYTPDTDGCLTWEIIRENDTVYIVRPDGTLTRGIQNSQFATYASPYASFELYEYASTLVPAQFREVWAQS